MGEVAAVRVLAQHAVDVQVGGHFCRHADADLPPAIVILPARTGRLLATSPLLPGRLVPLSLLPALLLSGKLCGDLVARNE